MRAKPTKRASAPDSLATAVNQLENIESLINGDGEITIGSIASVPCAATASDTHQCLAMLVRRRGESLLELLQRLDAAIASAYNQERFIDEINPPSAPPSKPAPKSRR
jgi:hypothetical protein